jgi:hypothetical protein
MPRTQKFDPLDFRNNRPAWALALQDKDNNAVARVDAALKEAGQDNIDPDLRDALIDDYIKTGNIHLAVVPDDVPEPAAVLPKAKPTEEEPSLRDRSSMFVGDAIDRFRDVIASGVAAEEASSTSAAASRARARYEGMQLSDPTDSLPGTAGIVMPTAGEEVNPDFSGDTEFMAGVKKRQAEKASTTKLLAAAAALRAKAADEKLNGGADTWLAKTIGSAVGQPKQILPTVGGMVGGPAGAAIASVPLANDVYDQAVGEALDFGATKDEADGYAKAIAGITFGIEAASGGLEGLIAKGKLGTKGAANFLKQNLQKKIASRTARIVGAGAVEAAENVAQEAVQDVTLQGMEATGTLDSAEGRAKLSKYNAERTATTLDRYLDSAGQGFVVGAAVASPVALVTAAADEGRAMLRL